MQQEIIVVPGQAYKPAEGQFGVRWFNTIKWHYCRELFHMEANGSPWLRGFYFALPKQCRERLDQFFVTIENQLNLYKRTKIYRTNIATIVYVRPAPFWNRQWMRYSLFTILCRAGVNYQPEYGMETALRSNPYIRRTWRAVQRFLGGRTRYAGFTTGWVDTFCHMPCAQRNKCRCADRRCRRQLDVLLVPWWQVGPISYIMRFGRFVGRLLRSEQVKKTAFSP